MKAKTATITLEYPVQLADKMLEAVTMRRPTMGDVLDNTVKGELDFAGEMQLYAVLCDLRPEDMRGLDPVDYQKLQEQYALFRNGDVKK